MEINKENFMKKLILALAVAFVFISAPAFAATTNYVAPVRAYDGNYYYAYPGYTAYTTTYTTDNAGYTTYRATPVYTQYPVYRDYSGYYYNNAPAYYTYVPAYNIPKQAYTSYSTTQNAYTAPTQTVVVKNKYAGVNTAANVLNTAANVASTIKYLVD